MGETGSSNAVFIRNRPSRNTYSRPGGACHAPPRWVANSATGDRTEPRDGPKQGESERPSDGYPAQCRTIPSGRVPIAQKSLRSRRLAACRQPYCRKPAERKSHIGRTHSTCMRPTSHRERTEPTIHRRLSERPETASGPHPTGGPKGHCCPTFLLARKE